MGRIPDCPASRPFQVTSVPTPSGDTRPTPVTTTRRRSERTVISPLYASTPCTLHPPRRHEHTKRHEEEGPSWLALVRSMPLEQADVRGLPANVPGHGGDHRGPRIRRRRADRRYVEHRVEREQLEQVVVRGSQGRRARTAIVRTGRADLPAAVRQLRHGRRLLVERGDGGRNVPDQPV